MPKLIPSNFHRFGRVNSHDSKRSIVDEESKAILRKWAWVDLALYERTEEIYRKKHALAEKCLGLFGELDSKKAKNQTRV